MAGVTSQTFTAVESMCSRGINVLMVLGTTMRGAEWSTKTKTHSNSDGLVRPSSGPMLILGEPVARYQILFLEMTIAYSLTQDQHSP